MIPAFLKVLNVLCAATWIVVAGTARIVLVGVVGGIVRIVIDLARIPRRAREADSEGNLWNGLREGESFWGEWEWRAPKARTVIGRDKSFPFNVLIAAPGARGGLWTWEVVATDDREPGERGGESKSLTDAMSAAGAARFSMMTPSEAQALGKLISAGQSIA